MSDTTPEQIEVYDLVRIAEREVIETAKKWKHTLAELEHHGRWFFEDELLRAITLLEAREAMTKTEHLDSPQRDPDHLNPAEGGNKASDDYW